MHWFHKLGFCLVSLNATLALVGQICKKHHYETMVVFPYRPCPYTLARANDMQLCCSIWFLSLKMKVTKCPWTTFWGDFQLDINRQPKVGLMNRQVHWYHGIRLHIMGGIHHVCMASTSMGESPLCLHVPVTALCIDFINYGFAQFPWMQLLHWWVNSAKISTVQLLVVFP